MIIYNITTNIHVDIHDEWLDWMQHKHIPEMIATGKFTKARLVRVLIPDEVQEATYSVQFYTDCKATLEKYYSDDAPRLRQESVQKFGEKALSFRTELQIISDHETI